MALKRHFHEQEGDGFGASEQESKRKHTIKTAVRDVMKGLSLAETVSRMEPFLRKVVREEVEREVFLFLHQSTRPSVNPIHSEARGFQLHFDNNLPSTIFTNTGIKAEDGTAIKIVIRDASSKKRITAGPLSSIKIEVLVLDGDFGTDDMENWTKDEFNAHVVRERDGKRPLVTGERFITLTNGVGSIFGDISFTDNSSWSRSRKFRLGGRIVQSTSKEIRIREARSEAFVVKDHRGELYKKHHPPSLCDEVWRLERIAKDGKFHTRLASNRINTVKDFLQLYETNPAELRSILGCGSSNRTWETIVDHASACVLDDNKWYTYYPAAQGVRLLFNSIYKLVGVIFDGQNLQSLDKLNLSQKHLVEELKQLAYRNVNDLVPIDDPSVVAPSRPLLSPQANLFGGPNLALQHLDFPVTHQGQPEMQLGFNHSTSPAYTFGVEANSQLEVPASQPMQVFTPTLINSFMMMDSCPGPYSGESAWTPSGSLGPALLPGHLGADEISEVQTSNWFPITETWGQGNSFIFTSSNDGEVGILSPLPSKPKAGWCKIRAAVKWGISVRRIVAAKKRTASFWYLDH